MLETEEQTGIAAGAARLVLLCLLAYVTLGWTETERLVYDAFPAQLTARRMAWLSGASVVLGSLAFASARGLPGLATGAAFGLVASLTGALASRWPGFARAIELSGGTFLGIAFKTLAAPALAASHAAAAAALTRSDWRPFSRTALIALVGAWTAATAGVDALLTRAWGFGPASLAQAAGVPTNAEARVLGVAWLYPSGGKPWRLATRRMSSETTDLSPASIDRLEAFLERAKFRGVFAAEALSAVRLGRLQWWEEERALDAAMLSYPGRAHPDYLRALEIIRAGPLTAERFGKLEQLSAATGRRVEGFEKPSEAQLIFEGFSAAYARFGDEAKAREWLGRLDGLWAVSEKKIEAGSLEDLREGRVDGTVLVEGGAPPDMRVGLFYVWRSSSAKTTYYWLSSSRVLDADGRFSFDALGPGRYVLALLAPLETLRGTILGAPGYFEVTYERPEVLLDPVRVNPSMTAPPADLIPDPPAPALLVPRAEAPLPPRR